MRNKQWVLSKRPDGEADGENLQLVESDIRSLKLGEVLIRNIYLSLDPTNRIWMSDRDQYLPPVNIGDVMRGGTIGVVESTRSERFAVGDIVMPAQGGWQEYVIADEKSAWRVKTRQDVPLTAYLSVLGATGYTAYFGLLDVCKPQAGEVLAVSAAAGAVGSIVGQIAKIKDIKVVGIAGGSVKCHWLVDDLGFDAAINYRNEDVGTSLDKHCPAGLDMNFENVGGAIMDAVFSRLRLNGRMALCGMISTYNDEGPMRGPSDFGHILMNRLTIRGFIVIDYAARFREAMADLSKWIADGRIQWKDHVIDGLESAVPALDLLFTGKNDGKLLVKVSPE